MTARVTQAAMRAILDEAGHMGVSTDGRAVPAGQSGRGQWYQPADRGADAGRAAELPPPRPVRDAGTVSGSARPARQRR